MYSLEHGLRTGFRLLGLNCVSLALRLSPDLLPEVLSVSEAWNSQVAIDGMYLSFYLTGNPIPPSDGVLTGYYW